MTSLRWWVRRDSSSQSVQELMNRYASLSTLNKAAEEQNELVASYPGHVGGEKQRAPLRQYFKMPFVANWIHKHTQKEKLTKLESITAGKVFCKCIQDTHPSQSTNTYLLPVMWLDASTVCACLIIQSGNPFKLEMIDTYISVSSKDAAVYHLNYLPLHKSKGSESKRKIAQRPQPQSKFWSIALQHTSKWSTSAPVSNSAGKNVRFKNSFL